MKKNKNADYNGPVNYHLKATILEVVDNILELDLIFPFVQNIFQL